MKQLRKKTLHPSDTDTLVGEGSVIDGKLVTKASLRIEGKVNGDIISEGDVTIGKQGAIASNVQARNVYVAGTVEGTVTTSGVLNITSTGKVFGNIHVKKLSIAEGGQFQGMSQMKAGKELKDNLQLTPSANSDKTGPSSAEDQTFPLRKPHLQKIEKEAQ